VSQAEAVANTIEAQRVAEAVAKGQVRAVGPTCPSAAGSCVRRLISHTADRDAV